MKKFEKWYNELPMREDAIDFTIPTYEDYKKGWRAALEWRLESEFCNVASRQEIEQELDDGST